MSTEAKPYTLEQLFGAEPKSALEVGLAQALTAKSARVAQLEAALQRVASWGLNAPPIAADDKIRDEYRRDGAIIRAALASTQPGLLLSPEQVGEIQALIRTGDANELVKAIALLEIPPRSL